MKNSIKNLVVATLGLVFIGTTAFAANGTETSVTVLKEIKNINKIVASGNVDVYVMQAPTESVKVYDTYYSKNALVQQKDGVLRISSFGKERLAVTVYVRNLSAIEASDEALVKTYGKVNFLALDVILKDKAQADINANTVSLFTSVKDQASLKLAGTAFDFQSVFNSSANMTTDDFVATSSVVKSLPTAYVAQAKIAAPTLAELSLEDELIK